MQTLPKSDSSSETQELTVLAFKPKILVRTKILFNIIEILLKKYKRLPNVSYFIQYVAVFEVPQPNKSFTSNTILCNETTRQ